MKSERFVQIEKSADGKTLSIVYLKASQEDLGESAIEVMRQDTTDTPNPQDLMIRISSWIFFECF